MPLRWPAQLAGGILKGQVTISATTRWLSLAHANACSQRRCALEPALQWLTPSAPVYDRLHCRALSQREAGLLQVAVSPQMGAD